MTISPFRRLSVDSNPKLALYEQAGAGPLESIRDPSELRSVAIVSPAAGRRAPR